MKRPAALMAAGVGAIALTAMATSPKADRGEVILAALVVVNSGIALWRDERQHQWAVEERARLERNTDITKQAAQAATTAAIAVEQVNAKIGS